MRLPVVIFKVPIESDKDITASCFSHDTCCFRCKSVFHLLKAWPHYYGWLNPSVIKARVPLFRNYANFPALLQTGSPCAAAIPVQNSIREWNRAHANASAWTLEFWKYLVSCLNIPVLEYSVKTGHWGGLRFSTSASRRFNWSRGPQVHNVTAAFSCQRRKRLLLFGICLSCLVHLWEKKETWATEPGWKANGNATLIKSKWQMYFCALTKPFGVLAFAMYLHW